MRSLLTRLGAAVGLSAVFMAPAAANAEPPVEIPPGEFVIDEAGVLGAEQADVEEAVSNLRQEEGLGLYVVGDLIFFSLYPNVLGVPTLGVVPASSR